MTTLAELVLQMPDPAHGHVIPSRPATSGAWRLALEIADPSAGGDVEWHDVTDFYHGDTCDLGAVEFMGICQPTQVQLALQVDNDDTLAPWGQDTSALFGVNVEWDAGLLVRLSWFRVAGGVTVEWEPLWTQRVETWGDRSYALGQIRIHPLTLIDTVADLVNVPAPASGLDTYETRIEFLLDQGSWPFGYEIYGVEPGDSGDPGIPWFEARPAQSNTLAELDATTEPVGLVWRSERTGALVFHPSPYDTLHGVQWPNPLLDVYPSGLVFSYNPDFTDIRYIVDDSEESFGIERTSRAVINAITATMPSGEYLIDDAVSRGKYGYKHEPLNWIVDNEPAVDDRLAAKAYATKQALPMRISNLEPGFYPAMNLIKHLDPVRIVHATREGGLVVTGHGYVRHVREEREYAGEYLGFTQVSTVQFDLVSTETSVELLPVESLAVDIPQSNYVDFTWTNPDGQPVEPTDTQIRILGLSPIWIDWPYPITAWSSPPLLPSTAYTLQVRLIRKVNGLPTHQSPVRELAFVTRPPYVPEIVPGEDPDTTNINIPDDVDDGCALEWELQENDGTGWVTIESGDQDDLVLGDDGQWHLPGDLDNSVDIDTDKLYRTRWREHCPGQDPGDWVYGAATDIPDDWTDPCVTPPALSEAPFDDADLLVYVPKVCAPNIIREAVSGLEGTKGPAYGDILQELANPDRLMLQAVDASAWSGTSGIIAFGECPQINGHTGDKTIAARVYITDATENVVLFECGAMRLTCVPTTGGWRAAVVIYTPGSTITLPSDTVLDVDTEYRLAATFDAATGDVKLYVDAVEDNAHAGSGADTTINALPIWRVGAPPESWVTDMAVFDRILAPEELPGYEEPPYIVLDDFDRADSTDLGSDWTEIQPNFSISGNELVTTTGANLHVRWQHDLGTVNHWAEITNTDIVSNNSNTYISVCCRMPNSTTETYYMGRYYGNTGRWEIYRRVAGTFTLLASFTESLSAAGIRIRLEVENNGSDVDLRLYSVSAPGGTKTLKVSATDTSGSKITSGNYIGLRLGHLSAVDDFDGGTL